MYNVQLGPVLQLIKMVSLYGQGFLNFQSS